MTELITTLLGPFATIAALLYLRLAVAKVRLRDNKTRIIGAWLAFFVMGYLAFFRALDALDVITTATARDWMLPMGLPVYGVHIYVSSRLLEDAKLRHRMRVEAARQRREVAELLGGDQ